MVNKKSINARYIMCLWRNWTLSILIFLVWRKPIHEPIHIQMSNIMVNWVFLHHFESIPLPDVYGIDYWIYIIDAVIPTRSTFNDGIPLAQHVGPSGVKNLLGEAELIACPEVGIILIYHVHSFYIVFIYVINYY